MDDIKLSAIVAVASNHVIGKDNTLIWHVPEDLKHFKRTTMGKPIIMGRKSYDSIGKPLPGRPNIVISRRHQNLGSTPTPHFAAMESVAAEAKAGAPEGPFLYASIADGIAAAKTMATELGIDEVFITGGGEIYRQALPLCDRLYLTRIHRDYDGDTYFPEINEEEWTTISREDHDGDPGYSFIKLERNLAALRPDKHKN